MGYKELRKFRDGTVMVDIDGVLSIVGAEENAMYKENNWPALVAAKLQKQFPHMHIEYVDEDVPGISVTCAKRITKAFCSWDKTVSPGQIYGIVLPVISNAEMSAIESDSEYFVTHYIKTKTYE